MKHPRRTYAALAFSSIAALALVVVTPLNALAASTQNDRRGIFSSAAIEFGVPANVLLSVSYNESRWENHDGQASVNGGYGLMNLTTSVKAEADGRGDPNRPVKAQASAKTTYTLDEASKLIHVPAETLKKDDKQNVRGAAALLAKYGKDLNNGKMPKDITDWYDVVAKYSGAKDHQTAKDFADEVYKTMRSGAARQTTDRQQVSLKKDTQATPKTDTSLQKLSLQNATLHPNGTDCPSDIFCKFVPAGYAANGNDPTDYGNYDRANRPNDMKINYIVIHDTEGSFNSAISHFQDTKSYVSANYVVRSSDGAVVEMVRPNDISWGAGNWHTNTHAINIEHEGYANEGPGWYTEAMYKSSAKLTKYLAKRYNIPMDRQHIIGHDEVTNASNVADSHWDPGAYWDWDHYMALITGKSTDLNAPDEPIQVGSVVQITPLFGITKPEIKDCSSGTCTTLPKQGSNFVYLRTDPNDKASLISNKYLHPDSSPGSTDHADWGTKATDGQRFVVADTKDNWTAIWYDGKKAWFYNPRQANTTTVKGKVAMNRGDLDAVPVYATAYPEASAYPLMVPPAAQKEIYTLPKDQSYVVLDENPDTDYFYAPTVDYSKPYDHTVVKGQDKYVAIAFNHRVAFVKASDLQLQ